MSVSDGPSSSQSPPTAEISRAEWGLILVLVAIQFTHMVDFVIIMPLGGRLMRELAISEAQFAQIVSAYAWAAGIASLAASFVMDRFDRKTVLLTMYAGFALSTLFCGLAEGFEWLLVSRTLAGAFGGTAAVALMAVTRKQHTQQEQEERAREAKRREELRAKHHAALNAKRGAFELIEAPPPLVPLTYTITAKEIGEIAADEVQRRATAMRLWYLQNADWTVLAQKLASFSSGAEERS